MRGNEIASLLTKSRKVYGVVSDQLINLELNYSGTKAIKGFKNH